MRRTSEGKASTHICRRVKFQSVVPSFNPRGTGPDEPPPRPVEIAPPTTTSSDLDTGPVQRIHSTQVRPVYSGVRHFIKTTPHTPPSRTPRAHAQVGVTGGPCRDACSQSVTVLLGERDAPCVPAGGGCATTSTALHVLKGACAIVLKANSHNAAELRAGVTRVLDVAAGLAAGSHQHGAMPGRLQSR